ncbi:MAG: hypothetical protein H7A25_22125 [Leptospiraceae bacterium]|nr:hypothetical protein [Leptospiraceae bacterium]MCP5502612.1 hypothetical protein [Leptospiraceae bacterium]
MEGIKQKAQAKTVATANITLSGEQTIGTTAVVAGDRVLVVGQTNAAENGIYVASATAWTRSADANTWDELVSAGIWVQDARAFYRANISAGGTLGTTAISFVLVIAHNELAANIPRYEKFTITGNGVSKTFAIPTTFSDTLANGFIVNVLDNNTPVVVDSSTDENSIITVSFETAPANGKTYTVVICSLE